MVGSLLSPIKDLRTHPLNTGQWNGLYTTTGFSALTNTPDVWGLLTLLQAVVPSRILNGLRTRVGFILISATEQRALFGQGADGATAGLTFSTSSEYTSSHMVTLRSDTWTNTPDSAIKLAHELMHCIDTEFIFWGGTGGELNQHPLVAGPWTKIEAAIAAGTLVRASLYAFTNIREFLAVNWQYYLGEQYFYSIYDSTTAATYRASAYACWPAAAGLGPSNMIDLWSFFDTLNAPLKLPPYPPGYSAR